MLHNIEHRLHTAYVLKNFQYIIILNETAYLELFPKGINL